VNSDIAPLPPVSNQPAMTHLQTPPATPTTPSLLPYDGAFMPTALEQVAAFPNAYCRYCLQNHFDATVSWQAWDSFTEDAREAWQNRDVAVQESENMDYASAFQHLTPSWNRIAQTSGFNISLTAIPHDRFDDHSLSNQYVEQSVAHLPPVPAPAQLATMDESLIDPFLL